DHLKKPLILFANSPQPIEWNSPDGLPVHMVFLVLTPAEQSTVQLLILRDIANLFKNPKFSEKLIHIHQTPLIWQCFKEAFN
ncbi:MAG: PTS sugar transporter subunit IIA, partial [Candidatus Cloacimonetes bacterium]|nr:PTS sugar transporter subunit IIA [Candidatus Cloacimonadota bacterium]